MSTVTAKSERFVDAPASVVFRCISNYREHHQHFLPPSFSEYAVEEGGTGEGTVVSFTLSAGGRTRHYRTRVTVPEPGCVLEEHDAGSSLVTRFIVTPESGRSRVRIETTWEGARGVGGFFERMFAPAALKGIYDDELTRLDGYAKERAARL